MLDVIDAVQLARIERVHRGFLYQHLYAAACLLDIFGDGHASLRIETDEDIEVLRRDLRVYVQVKWRATHVGWGDVSDALARFCTIRTEHLKGRRVGACEFVVVSNAPPDAPLSVRVESSEWPTDVKLLFPGGPPCGSLPSPSRTLRDAIDATTMQARSVPYTRLHPETLVLKLAACVQLVATDAHTINAAALPSLFEQIVAQTQAFPSTMDEYVPVDDEHALDPCTRVQWFIGPSGSGKTTWAAQNVPLVATETAYFDATRSSQEPFLKALAIELAGQLLQATDGAIGSVLRPGSSAASAIAAIDTFLAKEHRIAFVVVDNAHVLAPADIGIAVRSCAALRWIVLSQPTPDRPAMAVELKVQSHVLRGWGPDVIASVLAKAGCVVDPVAAHAVWHLTSGFPLYVQNVAYLALTYHNGNVATIVEELELAEHPERTQQEEVILRAVRGLSSDAQSYLAALSVPDIPLGIEELDEFAQNVSAARRLRRELTAIAALEPFGNDEIGIRDAYRITARELFAIGSAQERERVYHLSSRLLQSGFTNGKQSIGRLRSFLRILGMSGQIKELVDIATSLPEWWREIGIDAEISKELRLAAANENLAPDSRFWALDTLAFFALEEGELKLAERYLIEMRPLIPSGAPGHMFATVNGKRMLVASGRGEWKKAERLAAKALSRVPHDPLAQRILRYNLALVFFQRRDFTRATDLFEKVALDYFDVLDLDPIDLVGKNPPEIPALLPDGYSPDDVKHLADSLDALAHCRRELGIPVVLASLHASKLFVTVNALSSAVRVGLDAARDFASGRHAGAPDLIGAVAVLENVILPFIVHERLAGHVIEARMLYSELLEAVGRNDDASRERARLKPYLRYVLGKRAT